MPENEENPEKPGFRTISVEVPDEIYELMEVVAETPTAYGRLIYDRSLKYDSGEIGQKYNNLFNSMVIQRYVETMGWELFTERNVKLEDYNMTIEDGQVVMKDIPFDQLLPDPPPEPGQW